MSGSGRPTGTPGIPSAPTPAAAALTAAATATSTTASRASTRAIPRASRARSRRAAPTCARRTTASATARPPGWPSPSTRPPLTWASAASCARHLAERGRGRRLTRDGWPAAGGRLIGSPKDRRCVMAMDTYVVLAASYDTLGAAEADYRAVGDLYRESGLIDTYDAAVITRDDAGKVSIVVKHEQPTRRGAWRGLGIGLVGGALVALFPGIGLGAGLLLGGAGGAGLGAMAGHVTAGMRRADLKDLGELLDDGHSGLIVVAASDFGERVERAVRHARGLTRKQLAADETLVEQDIDAAAPGAVADPLLDPDESYRQAEAAVREAEAEAAAAERAAERYSTFHSDSAPESGDLFSKLDDLTKLRDSGVLSEAEYESAKDKLLGG